MNNNIHKYSNLSNKSDLQLWNEIREGNSDALSKLFYRFYEDLFFYGKKLTNDNAHIADTIQNIFLKIMELKNKNSNVTYVKAYIFKIFRNKLLKKKQKSLIYTLIS
ncbi:MAG: sigma-70 family RNA polymerase sigma factor, partial [Bacteroidales bacterium]|nr:sigma-70 family RNA polymerase sigma factor [Bacteroidales bacterium]